MSQRPANLLVWFLRVISLGCLSLLPLLGNGAASPAATRQALDIVVERLNALTEWFDEAEEQRVRWLSDLKRKDTQVSKVAAEVELANQDLQAVNVDLAALRITQSGLETQRQEQAAKIAEHLAATYRMNGEDFLKLLLNQESPDALDRMARYHRYFTQARMTALQEFQSTLDELEVNRQKLESRQADERAKREDLNQRRLALVRERKQRKGLIAELDEDVESKTRERTRLETDRLRLEQLLAELRRRSADLDGSAFVASKQKLPWPLQGRLTHGFGQSRADGRLSWHGIVLAATEGTPITAVFRGRVVFADWLRGFGLLTILDHGSGYMTLYGHADILLKAVGDWVESGELIARAGRSGGQRTSGLYFEVRQKGAARDPVGWLVKR
ncbi:MAG: peptidoglycan DD-metalloendopeptidase family protein [Gammaproteobacteria bacterium]|nr:peptidoglycan DD-metalloendopeptidase family protein [Gammaproteobacteria bacterium]